MVLHALLTVAAFSTHMTACEVGKEERTSLLQLDWQVFDQTPHAGWRTIGEDRWQEAGCQTTAARLIEEYLEVRSALQERQRRVLHFHAGQLYALAGQPELAIPHFRRSINPYETPQEDGRWNAYVYATIAFLEHDRQALSAHRAELEARRGIPMNRMNLRLVRAFDGSLGSSYAEAMKLARTLPEVDPP